MAKKTATSYLFFENTKISEGFSILTNWNKTKRIIILTTKAYISTFNKISAEHAQKEGEGDKSLDMWKNIHKKFFSKELQKYNMPFDENCKVVCEEFKVVKVLEK